MGGHPTRSGVNTYARIYSIRFYRRLPISSPVGHQGSPTFSNGMVSLPLSFSCPSYLAGAASSTSASILALGAMAAATFRPAALAACALPGVHGQPSCTDGCQPFAHVELVGAHPNVTIDETTFTFTCPEDGCGIDRNCSTTAPENKCTNGWVMGRPFSTEEGHVVSSLIQSKASGWAEDLGASGGVWLGHRTRP